ncbi:hypothetical protein C8R44DRAFT_736223 [Mycena epipterygia]|nr:hypothetical protein C8R44DRAFT_736223 [Mycena epipterygia]
MYLAPSTGKDYVKKGDRFTVFSLLPVEERCRDGGFPRSEDGPIVKASAFRFAPVVGALDTLFLVSSQAFAQIHPTKPNKTGTTFRAVVDVDLSYLASPKPYYLVLEHEWGVDKQWIFPHVFNTAPDPAAFLRKLKTEEYVTIPSSVVDVFVGEFERE